MANDDVDNIFSLADVERATTPTPEPEPVAPAPPASAQVVDGEDIPQYFRGKKVSEVVARAEALEQSLRLSETARKAAELEAARQREAPQGVSEPAAPAELSDEQLEELMAKSPSQAVRYIQDTVSRKLSTQFEQRLKPLASGSVAAAEQAARMRWSEDFEVLGPEIEAVVDSIPDKSVLVQPVAWDNLVKYVRGDHMEKVIAHRARKVADKAREEQALAAGYNGTGGRPKPVAATPDEGFGLDDLEKEIARNLNMSYSDYAKWKK